MPAPKDPVRLAEISVTIGGAEIPVRELSVNHALRSFRSRPMLGGAELSPEEAAELRRELERFRDSGEVATLPPGSAIVTIPAEEATDA